MHSAAKPVSFFRTNCFPVSASVLSFFLCFGTGAQAESGVSAGRILVGQSAAFSGAASILGVQMNSGIKLYFESVNAQGGVFGRKLELQAEDDMYDVSTAAENTRELLARDKVFALFGYVGSATSEAAIPIFSKAKVPFFAPLSGSDSLRNPYNRYLFNLRASYAQEVVYIIRQIAVTKPRSIAVFYQDDTDGKGILSSLQLATKQANIPLVAIGRVPTDAVAVDDRHIRQAVSLFLEKKPDVILLASTYSASAALIKELRQAGFAGQFYSLSLVGSRALSEALGKTGKGVVISEVVPSPWSPKFAIVEEYHRAMKKAGKTEFDFTSLEGFMAAKTFVQILKQVGHELTREKFVDTAERMGTIDLGDFPVRFSPENHDGSNFIELVSIGKDGKFIH